MMNAPDLFALIALAAYTYALTRKHHITLLRGQALYCGLTSIHYLLLDNLTMSIMQALGALRFLAAIRWNMSKKIYIFFIMVGLISLILSYKNLVSVVSFLGYWSFSTASFFHKGSKMRVFLLIGNISFFLVAVLSNSIFLIITETVGGLINSYMLNLNLKKYNENLMEIISELLRKPFSS